MRISVFIVDDHSLVREGLRTLLAAHAVLEVVGTASNDREAVLELQRRRPNVLLMDISMPVMGGLEATRQIVERCPTSKVVIFSMHATIEHCHQAVRAGAVGYVLKESATEE